MCDPTLQLEKRNLSFIIKACVILHNMIVEDERGLYGHTYDYEHVGGTTPELNVWWDQHPFYSAYLCSVLQVQNPKQHTHLQLDLIEEIWCLQLAHLNHRCNVLVWSNSMLCFFFSSRTCIMYFF